jgi:hypothetical protein
MIFHALQNAGILAFLSILAAVPPVFVGVAYAIKPSEARLALMRPLSLAAIFAALCGAFAGTINILIGIAASEPVNYRVGVVATAEVLVLLFVAFGCLTVAWLCVAAGLRRQP